MALTLHCTQHDFLFRFRFANFPVQLENQDYLPTSPKYWPPDIVYAIPASSLLSAAWNQQTHTKLTLKRIVALPLVYILGMVAFSFATLFRVMRVFQQLFLLIYASVKWIISPRSSPSLIKFRAILIGFYALKTVSALGGILCPPAGYWCDRKINFLAPAEDRTFFIYFRIPIREALTILEFDKKDNPSRDQVKERYYMLAKTKHPDKNPLFKDQFAKIASAYDLLNQCYLIKFNVKEYLRSQNVTPLFNL